jgi:hypothetical protein
MKAYVDDILVKNMTYEGHLTDLEETFETMNKSNMKINSKKCFFGLEGGKFLRFIASVKGSRFTPPAQGHTQGQRL